MSYQIASISNFRHGSSWRCTLVANVGPRRRFDLRCRPMSSAANGAHSSENPLAPPFWSILRSHQSQSRAISSPPLFGGTAGANSLPAAPGLVPPLPGATGPAVLAARPHLCLGAHAIPDRGGPSRASSEGPRVLASSCLPRPGAVGYLTLTLTLLPGASTEPAFGLCALTLAFLLFLPLTLPSLHSAFLSTFPAAFSFLPFSLGTTQAV